MKKIVSILFVLILCLGIVSCGAPESSPSPAPTTEETPSLEPEATATPEPTPAPNLSLTTGLPTEEEYKPIAVMIENAAGARPQTGMQQADIVYEAMAEGSITRFLCIFNDNVPVVAGPVRSTRLYYINIQREWDAPLIHYGGPSDADRPSYVYGSDSNDIKVRVDGLKGKYNDYFWRDAARDYGVHSVYTDVTKVKDELYDYTPDAREPFTFDETVSYPGNTISTVGIPFLSGKESYVQFKYDSETDLLTRYQDGEVFEMRTVTEDADGKQSTTTAPMTVKNLIVQYAKTYTLSGDVKGRRMVDLVGSGKCTYFIGGKQVEGTWERESKEDSTHYYLEDGSPVVLKPGNTWIALQPDSDTITVK